jgi:hypothetical protein
MKKVFDTIIIIAAVLLGLFGDAIYESIFNF